MARNTGSGGIERKFVTSILWVGVIPMTLALVIGFWFARTGQQHVVEQNLSTAARITAAGVALAVEERIQMTERAARSPQIAETLTRLKAEAIPAPLPAGRGGDFTFYDQRGQLLGVPGGDPETPRLLAPSYNARVLHLIYSPQRHAYVVRIAAPVFSPGDDALIGFVLETQPADPLLAFAMSHTAEQQEDKGGNIHEVVDLGRDRNLSLYLEEGRHEGDAPILARSEVDPRLAAHILEAKQGSALSLKGYEHGGRRHNALLAYLPLLPGADLYVIVFRPARQAYQNVYLATFWTILVSSFVIAGLWIRTYRRVNKNIIRPVSLLNEGAQIIRQGDLELKLKIDTGDEIEELASSFNKMAASLLHNITQLKESEEKYRSLITSMRDGIYQTNAEGEIALINPAGVEILGYQSAEELIGLNLQELFIEQMDLARVNSELERHNFIERTRVWMKKHEAPAICVELSANSVFAEDGGFFGMEGIFRDVTQNVRLEQKARERSERIDAINQIANVINSSLEAGRVYESIVNEVRRLVGFDYAAVALFQQEDDSADGFEEHRLWPEPADRTPRFVSLNDADHCSVWVARERRHLAVDDLRESASPFAAQFPESIRSCLCLPLHAEGRIVGTLNLGSAEAGAFSHHEVEVLEQMTPHVAVAIQNAKLLHNLKRSLEEVTLARENLHAAIEELKTLDELKTNLLSNVSHELRTPLVAVMGYTDMILNGKVGLVNETQREYLGISLRNIEKLVTLIENLLDFSRLHRGDEELFFDTFDLVDCARTSVEIVKPVADSRDIAVVIDSESDQILVDGDKGKLGQVFNNLLSNAVKFNDHGGQVTVTMRRTDDMVEAAVSDSGIGIPEEAQDKIFTRFYQYDTSSTRKYGGTGIGLSIAQDIMRLHGGRISVSSNDGPGVTFRFTLPLSGAEKQQAPDGQARLPLPTETHLLIELVTQDRGLTSQIRNYLLSEGMDVIHAAYPAVAVALAEKYSPDCILIDTEAGPLGSVVVDEVLNDPRAGSLPIVLLTNDDELYEKFRPRVSGRVKHGFRKSALLSGIHYALSKGVSAGKQLGPKILCVDDDPEIVKFMMRCLENEGYQSDHCGTGEEALERVAGREYWLVLLDISMPGMDGWETCRAMKDHPALKGLQVHMVTAKPMEKSMNRIIECGADGYLLKPFRSEDLLSHVRDFESYRGEHGAAQ